MRHRKRANQKKRHTSGHGWAWLLFGVILGSILGSIGYLKWYESRPHVLPPVATKKTEKIPKPKFDFYTLLPDVKVDAPRSPSALPVLKTPPGAVATAPEPSSVTSNYRLQLASFKSFQDADAMKARLALSGFTVEIQSVTLGNGATWYRVQTPLLSSQQEALKMQSTLKAEAITSMVVPIKR